MKVIDLLNKIANGEAPKKIKYDGMIWHLEEDKLYYSDNVYLEEYCNITQCLNDEVEIIEKDKKIKKDLHPYGAYPDEILYAGVVNKLYEIIDKINKEN